MRKYFSAICCGCAFVVLSGCAGTGAAGHLSEAGPVPPARQAVLESFLDTYPTSFTLVQRIVLDARGRQYDFTGYLRLEGPGRFRALALGGMGGTLFDLEMADGAPLLHAAPPGMPPAPLLDGVIGDIAHLFDRLRGPEGWSARNDRAGATHFRRSTSGGGEVEIVTDPSGAQVVEARETRGGRSIRTARYSAWGPLAEGGRVLPGRIVLENRRWNYTLEITPLRLTSPVPFTPRPTAAGER